MQLTSVGFVNRIDEQKLKEVFHLEGFDLFDIQECVLHYTAQRSFFSELSETLQGTVQSSKWSVALKTLTKHVKPVLLHHFELEDKGDYFFGDSLTEKANSVSEFILRYLITDKTKHEDNGLQLKYFQVVQHLTFDEVLECAAYGDGKTLGSLPRNVAFKQYTIVEAEFNKKIAKCAELLTTNKREQAKQLIAKAREGLAHFYKVLLRHPVEYRFLSDNISDENQALRSIRKLQRNFDLVYQKILNQ